jgi:hypothetical protein
MKINMQFGFVLLTIIALVVLVMAGYETTKGVSWDQDQRLLIPAVPAHEMKQNVGNRNVVMIVEVVLILAALVYGIRYWAKTGKPVLVLMMVGAALCSFGEPYNSFMVNLHYVVYDDFTVFQFMGRLMPLWLIMLYMVGYGTLGVFGYLWFSKGITKKGLWIFFAFQAFVDIALELPLVNIPGLYFYNGNEPLLFMRYPLWMLGINGVALVSCIAMASLLTPHLKGWQWLILPLLMPVCAVTFGYGIISFPGHYVVNSPGIPWLVTQLGGIMSMALACGVIWAFSQFLCTDSHYDLLRKRL